MIVLSLLKERRYPFPNLREVIQTNGLVQSRTRFELVREVLFLPMVKCKSEG